MVKMEKGKYLYNFLKFVANICMTILYNPKVYGMENVPTEGPIILAGNHKHALDPLTIAFRLKRRVYFLAKIELFKGIHGKMFERIGLIKVDRSTNNPGAILSARRVLKKGGTIGIFPEGTRNRTENTILPFRKGTCEIAIKSKTPVVPFAIKGEYKPFRSNLQIEFGKPLEFKDMDPIDANKLLEDEVVKLLRK